MKKSSKKLIIGLFSISSTFIMASCGETIPSSSEGNNDSSSEVSSVTHSDKNISETWLSDKNYHWHTCSDCEEIFNKEKHTFTETTIPATEDSAAKSKFTCSVCGYSYEEDKTTFNVTFQKDSAHPDTKFTLYSNIKTMTESSDGKIKVGAIFAVEIDDGTVGNSTVTAVKANGVPMTAQTVYLYKYQMPEEDVVITVEYDNPDKEYSLTYTEVSAHPETYVTFFDDDPMTTGAEISKAKKGTKIYVTVSTNEDDTLAGVYVNGLSTTKVNETYGWMLTYFSMPEEDVEITISYEGETAASYSLTHDSKDLVSFGKSIDDLINGGSIVSATAGETIYVMVQNLDDNNPTTGVYYNGTLTTQDEEYGWLVSTFVMPSENVHITVTYQNDGEDTSYDYSLTYNEDAAHPTTKVKFAKSLADVTSDTKDSIKGANENDQVFVYIYGQENIVTGVYFNGSVTTQCSSGYGWSVTYFTMPKENVVITITYK